MRDDRKLLRWLDLSWFAPLPLSLALAIWAIMMRPDTGILAVLLVVQMALMAGACSVPAGVAARRSQVWWRRLAPSGFTQAVHRAWREQTVALLVLGLIGPAAAAVRAWGMEAWALVLWALALPLLGAALGTFAAWAWSGSLRPAGLVVWPSLAVLSLMMGLAPHAWLDATGVAAMTLGAGVLMSAWAWRASWRLLPRWSGVRPVLSRWRRPPEAMRRWRWDTLAFDDQSFDAAGHPGGWVIRTLPLIAVSLTGPMAANALLADQLAGRSALDFTAYVSLLTSYAMGGLLVRVGHWRLRLAPGGPSQRRQLLWMLGASTLGLTAGLATLVGYHAWLRGLGGAALALPLLRAACDAALAVALATWLRGLNNQGVVTLLAWVGITSSVGAIFWVLHIQGLMLSRGLDALLVEAAATALLTALAWQRWRHRVLRGARHGDSRQED
jgi:hypothetical protein